MNLLVLEEAEVGKLIPSSDRRWRHIAKVLKKSRGDRLSAGIVDGAVGEARVRELDDSGLVLDFEAFEGSRGQSPALAPLRLVLGFPRPIQAARILKELTSLGVAEIHLTGSELGEKSYAQSSIFKDGEFRSSLLEGAEQGGNPRLPRVLTHWSLRLCLEALNTSEAEGASVRAPGSRIFLHPYGGLEPMGALLCGGQRGSFRPPLTLAIGSERGWTEAELGLLGRAGFVGKSLGGRILKTETAAIAACVLALAGLGLL